MKDFLTSSRALFVVLAVMQLADITTGTAASPTRSKFSSKTLISGVLKKVLDWVFVLFSFLAAHVLALVGASIGVDLSLSETLGWVMVASLLYKECRSLFDNLQCLGVPIPAVLERSLLLAEREADGYLKLPGEGSSMELKLSDSMQDLQTKDIVRIKVEK